MCEIVILVVSCKIRKLAKQSLQKVSFCIRV